MTRTPLRVVPIQKRTRRPPSVDIPAKKLEKSIPPLEPLDLSEPGAHLSKPLPSPSVVSRPTSSTVNSVDNVDQRPKFSLWDWRATQIGSFMKKRRYLALSKRLELLDSKKEICLPEGDVLMKPPAVKSVKGKRSKYNPHEECFVTDVSHRSRRVVLFRKRRHAHISGHISDEMLRKVQVPVGSVTDDQPAFAETNLCSYADAERLVSHNSDALFCAEPSEARADQMVNVNRLQLPVVMYPLDYLDKETWLRLNREMNNPQDFDRDENNKKVLKNVSVRLRKTDFCYILSALETICFNETSEPNDPIVYCEGCDLCVHQNCFGITTVPSGAWFCRVCEEFGKKTDVPCRFCPLSWGTMKRTSEGEWAHFACSVWQMALRFDDLTTYEPISHEWDLKPESFLKVCSVCDLSHGSCIKCSVRNCGISFHPTCGLRGGLLMFVEDNFSSKLGFKMFTFCQHHSDKARRVNSASGKLGIEFALEQLDEDTNHIRLEAYKKSMLSQLERHFNYFVNWRRLADDLGIARELMEKIFDYWVQRRLGNANRPFINQLEANELFCKYRFRRKPIVKKTKWNEEVEPDESLVNEFAAAHLKLDRLRNLCTLSMRREKIKWQRACALRSAFDLIFEDLANESTHYSGRSLERLSQFWNDFNQEVEQVVSSPRKSKSDSPNKGKLHSDCLFPDFPILSKRLTEFSDVT